MFWCSRTLLASPNRPLWLHILCCILCHVAHDNQESLPLPTSALQTLTSVCLLVVPSKLLSPNTAISCNLVYSLCHKPSLLLWNTQIQICCGANEVQLQGPSFAWVPYKIPGGNLATWPCDKSFCKFYISNIVKLQQIDSLSFNSNVHSITFSFLFGKARVAESISGIS